jgi:hypothetical protein
MRQEDCKASLDGTVKPYLKNPKQGGIRENDGGGEFNCDIV